MYTTAYSYLKFICNGLMGEHDTILKDTKIWVGGGMIVHTIPTLNRGGCIPNPPPLSTPLLFLHHVCHAWPSTLPLKMTMSFSAFCKFCESDKSLIAKQCNVMAAEIVTSHARWSFPFWKFERQGACSFSLWSWESHLHGHIPIITKANLDNLKWSVKLLYAISVCHV